MGDQIGVEVGVDTGGAGQGNGVVGRADFSPRPAMDRLHRQAAALGQLLGRDAIGPGEDADDGADVLEAPRAFAGADHPIGAQGAGVEIATPRQPLQRIQRLAMDAEGLVELHRSNGPAGWTDEVPDSLVGFMAGQSFADA